MKSKCLLLILLLQSTALGKGDLDAHSVSVNDTRPDPGDLITVSWTAINRTGDYIGSSTQAVVLSTDTTIGDGDDVRLGTEGLGPLGGWLADSSPEVKTVRLPTSLTRGRDYWIGVIADYNNRRDESRENNNASGAVKITIRAIDLYASSLSINDNNPDLGDLVTVSWTANSLHDTPIGDSQQAVVLSTDSTITRDDQLLEREYLGRLGGALAASTRELRTITIPDHLNPGTTYYLGVIMDYDSEISESNESNNASLAGSFTPRGPDLRAVGLEANRVAFTEKSNSISAFPGEQINLEWTARNSGGGASDLFDFSQQAVRWSVDDTVDRNDLILEREPLGILFSGASSTELRTVRIPADVQIGETYYIAVEADADREFREENEDNNFSNVIEVTIMSPVESFAFEVSDYAYLPSLEGDDTFEFDDPRLRDITGDGDADPGATMDYSRCFAPGDRSYLNLLIEMDSDYTSLFNLTEDVRFTAYYNEAQSLTGSNLIGSMILNVGSFGNELNLSWNVPDTVGDYYLYFKAEVRIRGTWYEVAKQWLGNGEVIMVRNADPVIVIHGWSDKSGETFDNLPLLIETLLERPVRFFHYETSNLNNAPRVDRSYQELGIGEEKESLAVQLREFLESPEGRGREIGTCDIIAHSMGGLVARNFVLVESRKKVRRLITIGTPSYGGLFADTFVGDIVLNNQAEDLEYGCELTWKLHQEWALLANRERLPDTLTIAGTDDFGFGEYNQGDGVVTCSSASLESLGSLVYYVPGKHSKAFGPLGATAIARVDSTAHPSWDPIEDFLTSEEPSLSSDLPGHNGNADDVGHRDHPDPLPSGALYLARFATHGGLIPLDEDEVDPGHNEPFLGINKSGSHESSGIYFANFLTANSRSLGSRFYTEAAATVQGQQTGPIRIFAGQTCVYIIGRDSPEYRFGDLDGDNLPDDFEDLLINSDSNDSFTSHLQIGPEDDPDGDDIGNLLEAALGTHPLERNPRPLEVLPHQSQILVRYPEPKNTESFRLSLQVKLDLDQPTPWQTITVPGALVDGKILYVFGRNDEPTFYRLTAEPERDD